MTAIMENIKTALFSEIKALSPLFVNGEEGRGDLLRIDAADRSYLNIQILGDGDGSGNDVDKNNTQELQTENQ